MVEMLRTREQPSRSSRSFRAASSCLCVLAPIRCLWCPRTQEQSQLTRRQLMFVLGELIVAGSDTTSNSVAFSVFLLATHPKAEARLVEEIRRLEAEGVSPDSVENLEKYQYCLMVRHAPRWICWKVFKSM